MGLEAFADLVASRLLAVGGQAVLLAALVWALCRFLPRLDARAQNFASQAKPTMMALNVPTYINLYGYGYRNVYELDELVDVNDPRITFEGSIVSPKP